MKNFKNYSGQIDGGDLQFQHTDELMNSMNPTKSMRGGKGKTERKKS